MNIDLNAVVDEMAASHAQAHAAGTAHVNAAQAKASLADIIAKLKAAGITLPVILQFLGPILTMLFAGTPAASIIAAILAALGKVATP